MKMAVQGVHTRLVNYNQILGHVADQDYMEFIDYIDRYRSHPEYLYHTCRYLSTTDKINCVSISDTVNCKI